MRHYLGNILITLFVTLSLAACSQRPDSKGAFALQIQLSDGTDITALVDPMVTANDQFIDPDPETGLFSTKAIKQWPAKLIVSTYTEDYTFRDELKLEQGQDLVTAIADIAMLEVKVSPMVTDKMAVEFYARPMGEVRAIDVNESGVVKTFSKPGEYLLRGVRAGKDFSNQVIKLEAGNNHTFDIDLRYGSIEINFLLPGAADIPLKTSLKPIPGEHISGPADFGRQEGSLYQPIIYDKLVPGEYFLKVNLLQSPEGKKPLTHADRRALLRWEKLPITILPKAQKHRVELALENVQ